MDLQLAGKLALVTGSTAGIGLAIAKTLAAEGAEVVINGRTQSRVNMALAAVKLFAPDAKLQGIAQDLGTKTGIEAMLGQLPKVDILINNLGIYAAKPFKAITDEDWMKIFEINVLSGVRLSRAYLTGMLATNWGRIIFISSESGINIPAEMIHYGVSKTAQLALSRGLAETTASTGVTVNSVLPGPTMSEGVEEFVRGLATQRGVSTDIVERDFFQTMRPSSLLKRFATAEEVAAIVAYVASPRSSATNGAALRVDGGVVRSVV